MKILFVHRQDFRGFIRTDYELLSRYFDVTCFHFKGLKSIPLLFWEMRKHDLIFVWFISLHAFFTCFSRKPKVFVAGGYDVAFVPSINYGLSNNRLTRWMVSFCLNHASCVLSVSHFNNKEIIDNFNYNSPVLVYNCADDGFFKPDGVKNDNLVITVGNVNSKTWVKKGISRFIEVAKYCNLISLPFRFVVVGRISDDVEGKVDRIVSGTPNLSFTGFVSDEELRSWYQKAKVYLQLSKHESFGVSVVESMLFDCIPVVSDKAALPEVVYDSGFIVDPSNISNVADAVISASRCTDSYCDFACRRFGLNVRGDCLKSIVEGVCI